MRMVAATLEGDGEEDDGVRRRDEEGGGVLPGVVVVVVVRGLGEGECEEDVDGG